MSLIKCIECEKKFSDRSSACPNCGCPTEIILKELDEYRCRAQEIIIYPNDNEFESEESEKAFEMLCECLNSYETSTTIFECLDLLAQYQSSCATETVNKKLLDKITNKVLSYFEPDEKSLFYADGAVMFYGKEGILITNKAIYRIRKEGMIKLLFSELETIELVDVLYKKQHHIGIWRFNCIPEFDLSPVGIDTEQTGMIMALVCLLFHETVLSKRIKCMLSCIEV